MKTQTLTVSMVLLLIAVAALPGLSFSLSSSVTSYNNSITIEKSDSVIGLYTDSNCREPWTRAAFDGTVIPLEKKTEDKTIYYVIERSVWTMGLSSSVFLYIDGEDLDHTVVIKPSLSGSTKFNPSRIQVKLGNDIDSGVITWDEATTKGISLTVADRQPYLVTITMYFPTDVKVPNVSGLDFTWGISFTTNVDGTYHTASNTGNGVSFMVTNSSMDGIFIDNGTLKKTGNDYLITDGKKDSFGTQKVELTTDGTQHFKIQLLFELQGSGSFKITIKDSSGEKVVEDGDSEYISRNGYIGSQKEFKTGINDVDSFNGAVTITIEGDQHDQGNRTIQLKLIVTSTAGG